MAKEEKYDSRIDAIMAWLNSYFDDKEEPKKIKLKKGEKSLAEQINWGGKFKEKEERSEGGSIEKKFEINSYEVDGEEMLAIDFKDGKRIFENQMYKMFEVNKTGPMPNPSITDDTIINFLRENNPTRDEFIKHFTTKKLAKGGTSMDEQMSMFNEGGLLDEGGEVDEESGNEVPIGGTKEGVRDDIPAMLSEGEFVFPEDVTRYHGLEKLMTLRQEAKMGLKKMEAMGQMGNSEEATIPDDLPFTMDDLILVVGEGEPKEKDDEPIKAQAGTFVPANQQLNNMGVMGFQESMYGQQGLQNPTAAVIPQVPASSVVPTVQAPQVGGYSAPTVPATPVKQPNFVPPVDEIYKSVKYINPTTGETMMINEYQGNPVSAVPAGFIRYDDYIAQGGKDPNEEITGTTTGTGVETAQVGGTTSDDERREETKLFDTLKANTERNRIQKFNNLLTKGSEEWNSDSDGSKLLEEYKKAKTGQGLSALLPGIGLPASLLARKNVKNIEDAMVQKFGEKLAKEKMEEISMLSSAKDTIGGIGKGIKDTFFEKGGLDNYNKSYDAQYSLEDFTNARGGYNNVNINFVPVQGYIKGSANNNLSSQQQQHFDNAIRNGDMSMAMHFEMIARSNAARDQFAKENAKLIKDAQRGSEEAKEALKKKVGEKTYNGIRIGVTSVDSIVKNGGSVVSAVDDGRAEAGGTFKSAKVVQKVGVAGEKGPIKTPSNTKPQPSRSNNNNEPSLAEKMSKQAQATRKAIDKADKNLSKNRPKGTTFRKSSGGRGFTGGFKEGGLMKGKK